MTIQRKPAAASAPPPALFVRVSSPGTGGIATYVLDGWGLASKLQPILEAKRELRLCDSGDLIFGKLFARDRSVIDEAVLSFLESNETATGFEQVELSCHGGAGSSLAVEDVLVAAGFERGSGADLLARAHSNNKLSLVDVEAQLMMGRVTTARQSQFVLGAATFRKRWERIGFDAAMALRTSDASWREKTLIESRDAVKAASGAMASLGQHDVVIAGPVNAGKSTLANQLLRANKNIVSGVPGTTRDRLETRVAINGLSVMLSDTAGLRETDGTVEREGQRRARAALETAALRVIVLDGSKVPAESDLSLIAACKALGPSILVLNKEDLGIDETAEGLGFLVGVEPIVLSAKGGAGIESLESAIENALLNGATPAPGDPFTQRQVNVLNDIKSCIENGWEDTMVIRLISKLVGTRFQPEQLKIVLSV